jgi:glycosyltransferase involved in cell wall biosynthesis
MPLFIDTKIHDINRKNGDIMDKKPLVSIGMPTCNGERFIRHALDSLLAQDYTNFELIISDNASTDGTQMICQEYVAKDKRIQYRRNRTNLGSIANFRLVFELSRGKYFMFAGDHDLWHTTFISRCVAILEQESRVVLAYSRTMLIDIEGRPIKIISEKLDDNKDKTRTQRYKYLVPRLGWCEMYYGLIRREMFTQIEWNSILLSIDRLQLTQMTLCGAFAQIDEVLFYLRKNRQEENAEEIKKRWVYTLDPTRTTENLRHSLYYFKCVYYLTRIKVLASFSMSLLEKLDLISFTILDFLLFTISSQIAPFRSKIGRILRKIGLLKNSY